MLYTLPDGRSFEQEKINRISRIRDAGAEAGPIGYSTLSFHIDFRGNEVIEVSLKYLYSDWAEQKKKLTAIRSELLRSIRENGGDVDDS